MSSAQSTARPIDNGVAHISIFRAIIGVFGAIAILVRSIIESILSIVGSSIARIRRSSLAGIIIIAVIAGILGITASIARSAPVPSTVLVAANEAVVDDVQVDGVVVHEGVLEDVLVPAGVAAVVLPSSACDTVHEAAPLVDRVDVSFLQNVNVLPTVWRAVPSKGVVVVGKVLDDLVAGCVSDVVDRSVEGLVAVDVASDKVLVVVATVVPAFVTAVRSAVTVPVVEVRA